MNRFLLVGASRLQFYKNGNTFLKRHIDITLRNFQSSLDELILKNQKLKNIFDYLNNNHFLFKASCNHRNWNSLRMVTAHQSSRMTNVFLTRSFIHKPSLLKSNNIRCTIPYNLKNQKRSFYTQTPGTSFSDHIRYELRRNVIYQLAAVNLGIFILWQTLGVSRSGQKFMMDNFTVSAQNIAQGRLWTLFTSEISHFNLMHFLFNMIAMISIGESVRQAIGNERTLWLYLVGSLSASLAHIYWTYGQYRRAISKKEYDLTPNERMMLIRGPPAGLGASGAVCAILGAFAVLWPRKRLNFMFIFNPTASTVVITICLFDFIGLWNQNSILGHSGHLGGALSGVAFALILRRLHRL